MISGWFGLDLRAKLEFAKLSFDRLPPDCFRLWSLWWHGCWLAGLSACWFLAGLLLAGLLACRLADLACWFAGLLAFWFAMLARWHLLGLLVCWLAEWAQWFAALRWHIGVLVCQFACMLAGWLVRTEYPMKQHYRHSGNRRCISLKLIWRLEQNLALSVPPLRLGLTRRAAANQRLFFVDFSDVFLEWFLIDVGYHLGVTLVLRCVENGVKNQCSN